MRTSRNILTALVFAALLSSCSGGTDEPKKDKPRPVAVGQCLDKDVADGDDRAPDFTSVVKCSEPHVYEVLQVTPIPKKFLSGKSAKTKLANRKELATIGEPVSELTDAMRQEVYPECARQGQRQSGLGDLTVKGKPAKDVLSVAASGANTWFNLNSPKQWLDGQTNMVCMVRYESLAIGDTEPKVLPVSSPDDKPLFSHYTEDAFPIAARRCSESQSKAYVDCAKSHRDELLFIIDMRAVYGKSFLKGLNLKSIPEADLRRVQSACADVYKQLGYSLPGGREFGYRFPDDVESTPNLPLTCVIKGVNGSAVKDYAAFTG